MHVLVFKFIALALKLVHLTIFTSLYYERKSNAFILHAKYILITDVRIIAQMNEV
jgi:hypothetical protein